MHKTMTRNLRFGCGASLHSAFLYSHKQYWQVLSDIQEKDDVSRVHNNRRRGRGNSK